MKPRGLPRGRFGPALLFSLLAVAGPAVGAEEKTADTGNSITAAKRDLEALKSAKGAAAQSRGEMPQLTLPEFTPAPAAGTGLNPRQPKKSPLEPEQKSKNWLRDGVELERKIQAQQGQGRRSRGDIESERALTARDELRSGPSTETGERLALMDSEAASDRKAAAERERAAAPAAVNPLAGFMAGWMTSQDYALLQPSTATGTPKEGGAAENFSAAVALPGGSVLAPGNTSRPTPEFFGGSRAPAPPAARENPFLQVLNAPPPELGFGAVPPAPAAVPPPVFQPAPVFAPTPPPSAPAGQSKVPDFARPPTDDKYFKQLKRF